MEGETSAKRLEAGAAGLKILVTVLAFFHVAVSFIKWYDTNFYVTHVASADLWMGVVVLMAVGVYAMAYFSTRRQMGLRLAVLKPLSPEIWLLAALLGWYVVSCIYVSWQQGDNWFIANDFYLFDTAVNFLVLFPLPYIWKDRAKTVINAFLYAMVGVLTVLMLVVLWNVFRGKVLTIPNGQIGMDSGKSLIIACNRNFVGMLGVLITGLSIYLAVASKNKIVRGACVFAALVHFVVTALSNSRASFVGLLAALALLAFVAVWHWLKEKKWPVRLVLSLLAAACAVALVNAGRALPFSLLPGMGDTAEEAVREIDTNLSGRLRVWENSLKGWTLTPGTFIFGVTPQAVSQVLSLASDGDVAVANTHNQFLEMALALGLPGLLIYIGFIGLLVYRCFRVLFVNRSTDQAAAWAAVGILLTTIVNNLAEARMLFNHFAPSSIFFLLAGWIVLLSRGDAEAGVQTGIKSRAETVEVPAAAKVAGAPKKPAGKKKAHG